MTSNPIRDREPSQARLTLRMMQSTDLHGHLTAYDYTADRALDAVGLTRLATLIAAARKDVENTLLLDGGDFLFGNPLSDGWATLPGPRPVHPVIEAMNALGYDAAVIGNHEFNFGLAPLGEALSQAGFPILGTNLEAVSTAFTLPLAKATMLRRGFRDASGGMHELAIGVVGVVPPQVMQWDARHLSGHLVACGMVGSVRRAVPELWAAGADLVVVLNHSGIGDGSDDPMAENAGLALAQIDGVDAVFCGHKHLTFPGPDYAGQAGVDVEAGTLAGVPAVMAGFHGSHLGVIDLDLAQEPSGRWRVTGHRTALRPISARETGELVPLTQDDPAMAALTAPAHRATLARLNAVVGHIPRPVHSYLSQVAPCPVSALVAAAQMWRARDLLGAQAGDLPMLSAAAPFRCGGTGGPENYTDVPAGPVRQKDLHGMYPFPNDLRVVRVTGAQVIDWLEQSAGQFRQIVAGQTWQSLIAPAFPSYNFDILHGVSYAFDVTRPARYSPVGDLRDPDAGRVCDVTWNGVPVDPGQSFLVVTNSYRADGGGNFAALRAAETVLRCSDGVQTVLEQFLRAGMPGGVSAQEVWRFVPVPGTRAQFRTGPGVLSLGDAVLAGLGCGLGRAEDGFERVSLRL